MKYHVMKLNTELQKWNFILGDKMLGKHNPKIRSSERKHLLMRIDFISFHPQWKFMWTENFSWWNKILFQDSSNHLLNVNLKKAVRSTCTLKLILIFFPTLLQTSWPKRLGCFILIWPFNSSCKTYCISHAKQS